MESFILFVQLIWKPALLGVLAVTGLAGALAVTSPRHFHRVASFCARTVDTDRLLVRRSGDL